MVASGYVIHDEQLGKITQYYIGTKGTLVVLAQFEKFPQFRKIRNPKILKEV